MPSFVNFRSSWKRDSEQAWPISDGGRVTVPGAGFEQASALLYPTGCNKHVLLRGDSCCVALLWRGASRPGSSVNIKCGCRYVSSIACRHCRCCEVLNNVVLLVLAPAGGVW